MTARSPVLLLFGSNPCPGLGPPRHFARLKKEVLTGGENSLNKRGNGLHVNPFNFAPALTLHGDFSRGNFYTYKEERDTVQSDSACVRLYHIVSFGH